MTPQGIHDYDQEVDDVHQAATDAERERSARPPASAARLHMGLFNVLQVFRSTWIKCTLFMNKFKKLKLKLHLSSEEDGLDADASFRNVPESRDATAHVAEDRSEQTPHYRPVVTV